MISSDQTDKSDRFRSVVVTGASSGIGAATASHLAARGFRVVAVGRSEARTLSLVASLEGAGHSAVLTDLREPEAFDRVEEALGDHASVYGLAHCAGTQAVKPIRATRPADFREMYDIHVVVAAEMMRRLAARIGRSGSGSFVLMSSVAAVRGGSGMSSYAAAKAAVIALSRAAALEFASQGIRVNAVVAGVVETPMSSALLSKLPEERRHELSGSHPLGIGSANDVAEAISYLMSSESRWVTGSTLNVDGGYLAL